MTDFGGLIRALADGGVDCILVGGVAATIHGSARLTRDVDVVYSRGPDNLARIVAAAAASISCKRTRILCGSSTATCSASICRC